MSTELNIQMHQADVRTFAQHHGRVLTWLYANRRMVILGIVVLPLCTLVTVAAPIIAGGCWLAWMMHSAAVYVTQRNWRDD